MSIQQTRKVTIEIQICDSSTNLINAKNIEIIGKEITNDSMNCVRLWLQLLKNTKSCNLKIQQSKMHVIQELIFKIKSTLLLKNNAQMKIITIQANVKIILKQTIFTLLQALSCMTNIETMANSSLDSQTTTRSSKI